VLKGVLHPKDAEESLQHQVDGLIVSNHGARNLDTIVPTIEAYRELLIGSVAEFRSSSTEAFGRGSDILKSLARVLLLY